MNSNNLFILIMLFLICCDISFSKKDKKGKGLIVLNGGGYSPSFVPFPVPYPIPIPIHQPLHHIPQSHFQQPQIIVVPSYQPHQQVQYYPLESIQGLSTIDNLNIGKWNHLSQYDWNKLSDNTWTQWHG